MRLSHERVARLCVEIALYWQSAAASHCDRRHFEKLNLWRDYFPADLGDRLAKAAVGDVVAVEFPTGELVPSQNKSLVQYLKRHQFIASPCLGVVVTPRAGWFYVGRFYPGTLFDTQLFFIG